MAFWDRRANAMLVLPKPSQGPLWIIHAEDFVPVVWEGGSSFFIPPRESFVPPSDAFYFLLRASHTVQDAWYVWVPEQHRRRIRINGEAIGSHAHIIRDADIISARPPKSRDETLSISFFLPSPFLNYYTPGKTLRCGVVNRTYACASRDAHPPKDQTVTIVRVSRFPDFRSFHDRIQRKRAIVNFLRQQKRHKPHIIQFHEVYCSPASAYFVTERIDRYLDCILNEQRKYGRRLAICKIREYARGVCLATEFLHSFGIVLRNLSIKNICVYNDVPRLSDFTAADYLPLDTGGVKELINANDYAYLAPEALEEIAQDEKVDCWSVGMIFKALLLGLPVANGFLEDELYAANLSDSTIDVVRRLLCENPRDRRSMRATLKHPWFFK